MPYDPEKDIADGSGSQNSLSELEDCPLNGEEQRFLWKLQLQRKWKPYWASPESSFWKVWSIVMTITRLILLIININSHSGPTGNHFATCLDTTTASINSGDAEAKTWKKANLVETKFYRDLRYMTLSHDNDWLREEHTDMVMGNILLPDEDGSGNRSLKGISM